MSTDFDEIPFAIEVNEEEEALNPEGAESAVRDAESSADGAEGVEHAVRGEENVVRGAESAESSADDSTASPEQLTLREILFGDFILGTFLRRHIWFLLFLMALTVLYISNRYAAQQEIIEEEQLRQELTEKKNYALTQYAELTMASRQSGIEQRLRAFGDTLLTTPTEAPFIIEKK